MALTTDRFLEILGRLPPGSVDGIRELAFDEQLPLSEIVDALFNSRARQGQPVQFTSSNGWARTRAKKFPNN
jgi:hypothetical protein